ncbi:hypothetical protein TWF281_008107 [Arthrobotrys megalospora]
MSSKPFIFPFISSKLKPSSGATPAATTAVPTPLPNRPILTHLNADTTWLLLLPYPENISPSPPSKRYFRILLDPWLSGPQSDVFSWFSTQWHAITPSLGSIKDVEEFISTIDGGDGNIDAVIISHEFTDHCHKATLLEVDKRVPVFANDKACGIIRGWGHFENVVEVGRFMKGGDDGGGGWDWREKGRYEGVGLPGWIGISRVESVGNALYYHSSVMVVWEGGKGTATGDGGEEEEVECILYTPHGTVESALKELGNARPRLKVLGLMHGLHDVKLGVVRYKQLNLGMKNAVEVVRGLNGGDGVKYWVGTHDERKVAGGVVGRMLWRKAWTVEDINDDVGVEGCYVEVGNGESLVME